MYSTSDIETLRQLGETVLELYSGYYLRIYHNISEEDPVHQKLCGLFCFNDHIDVCDVRKLGNQSFYFLMSFLCPGNPKWLVPLLHNNRNCHLITKLWSTI